MNHLIRAQNVRTIDDKGRQLGVIALSEAVDLALKANLDLVEVAPDADPPVCRIMDFGKFRYEQTKKEKEARKKQHVVKVKEIKFHPNIEDHDYGVKLKHIFEFLKKGNKVKVSLAFRGREFAHMDYGKRVLERLVGDVVEVGAVEQSPKLFGRNMIMIIGPTKSK
ncbi:MAG: translation initiation factor IF-3 [Chlamydiae bacterium]|nr:translation initiation factor IF-3 [Chlamydiota bacterium]